MAEYKVQCTLVSDGKRPVGCIGKDCQHFRPHNSLKCDDAPWPCQPTKHYTCCRIVKQGEAGKVAVSGRLPQVDIIGTHIVAVMVYVIYSPFFIIWLLIEGINWVRKKLCRRKPTGARYIGPS